jgi:predicted DNA-binding transcriptional regulator YafY
MESSKGWNIPLERVKDGKKMFYRYADPSFSISNEPINVLEAEQIKAALLVFQRIKGLPQFKWMHTLVLKLEKDFQLQTAERECISFDNNEYLRGIEHIGTLFNAILYKRVLSIVYQSFNSTQSTTIVLSPYYLKQFNNRWFLFGKSSHYDNLTNLALDRIESLEELNFPYETTSLDFDEYFEDVLGVTVPEEAKLTKIIFRVAESLAPYIQTKPIHGSQKQLSKNSKEFLFSIEVLPNYELEKHLLAFGEDLIVIEPHDFRNKIRDRLLKSIKKYKSITFEK